MDLLLSIFVKTITSIICRKYVICLLFFLWRKHGKSNNHTISILIYHEISIKSITRYTISIISSYFHLSCFPIHSPYNFMAHSTIWDPFPIQRQNTNSKKLTIDKLSKSSLGRCTKFGRAHSNNERKIIFSLILYEISEFNTDYVIT